MATPFNIDSFAAELGRGGIAKPYLFSVIVTCPNLPTKLLDPLRLRIESASLPRRTLATVEQRYHGPERKIPYAVEYSNMNLEIIMSENMIERELFMQWQDLFTSGGNNISGHRLTGNQNNYDATYYDECIGTVELFQYAESPAFQGASSKPGLLDTIIGTAQAVGINTSAITNPFGINLGIGAERNRTVKPCYTVKYLEAYPISVSEIAMGWSNDGPAKLSVEMQFRTINETHSGVVDPKAQGGLASLIRSGVNTLNAFRPAIGLIKQQGLGGALGSLVKSTGASAIGGSRGLFTF